MLTVKMTGSLYALWVDTQSNHLFTFLLSLDGTKLSFQKHSAAMNCIYFSDLKSIFQYYGSKKTQRLLFYPTPRSFHIQLRFSTETCKGQLVEITSEDANCFLRITLPGIGPIRVSYSTPYGKNHSVSLKGEVCDGKRHSLWFSVDIFRVSYRVDKVPVRFYAASLRRLFLSPPNIVFGKGLKGCVSGSIFVFRRTETRGYRVGTSSGCSMNSKYHGTLLISRLEQKHTPIGTRVSSLEQKFFKLKYVVKSIGRLKYKRVVNNFGNISMWKCERNLKYIAFKRLSFHILISIWATYFSKKIKFYGLPHETCGMVSASFTFSFVIVTYGEYDKITTASYQLLTKWVRGTNSRLNMYLNKSDL